ncbi:hypothetical protein LBMAG48_10940 [Phycisphaerae bacterium]|nr:hypothetical protein LBMAG48_10940 [Phycisphaerae bacterium]
MSTDISGEYVGSHGSSVAEYLGGVVADIIAQVEASRSRLKIVAEKVDGAALTPSMQSQAKACDAALGGAIVLLTGLGETVRLHLECFGSRVCNS